MSGKIFGRPIPEEFAYVNTQLSELESNGTKVENAIAENIRIDDRVSETRAASFLSQLQDGSSSIQIELDQYARNNGGNTFHNHTINANNLLYEPRSVPAPQLRLDLHFVTIVDFFPELRKELSNWLSEIRIKQQNTIDVGGTSDEVDEWLLQFDGMPATDELQTGIAEAHKRVLDIQLEEAKKNQWSYSERIVWVGLYDEFSKHLSKEPRHWLELFGLGHLLDSSRQDRKDGNKNWLLLLSYEMSATSAVARPSVLEAGAFEWHYPTPSYLPISKGGRTMLLGESQSDGCEPMTEFIHNNRRYEKEDILGVFQYYADSSPLDIESTRKHHKEWLTKWAEENEL